MKLTENELYKIIESIGVESTPPMDVLVSKNIKTIFTSIEFISLIIALEERYKILIPREILEADSINFKLLRDFINNADG